MPFDPALPLPNSEILSAVLRDQFNGLKELIDSIPAGPPGPPGPTGPPGEVTAAQLASAIADALTTAAANSSANSNAVATIGQPAEVNYSQSQMQEVLNKIDELILALRR